MPVTLRKKAFFVVIETMDDPLANKINFRLYICEKNTLITIHKSRFRLGEQLKIRYILENRDFLEN